MADYGQFCSVARAHEAIGGRWTLLVVRELLCGSRRFNDIRRGIPRISRTMLSERLQDLVHVGAVIRIEGEHGPEYTLTEAGRELMGIVGALGTWGQRWLPRQAGSEDLDLEPVLVDMQRRVRLEALPTRTHRRPLRDRGAAPAALPAAEGGGGLRSVHRTPVFPSRSAFGPDCPCWSPGGGVT